MKTLEELKQELDDARYARDAAWNAAWVAGDSIEIPI